MPIKCLSVHTATIQRIPSFSLLHCTDTEYTQWSIENILFILLYCYKPAGCECILREPFKEPRCYIHTQLKFMFIIHVNRWRISKVNSCCLLVLTNAIF